MMRNSDLYETPGFKEFAKNVIADGGYQGDVFVVTHKKSGKQNERVNLDLYTMYSDLELKIIRGSIEQEFGTLKKTFNVLSKRWPMTREFQDPCFRVCVYCII